MVIVLHNPNHLVDGLSGAAPDLTACVPVAALETDSLQQAFLATQNQESDQIWVHRPGMVALPAAWGGARSTSVGDVLIDAGGGRYLVVGDGFRRIHLAATAIGGEDGLVAWT
ncbi:MAG TPA: hypothetical protein VNL71_02185 [Chloroflexota bacterium]|nr:hypothetical protein [Chloroflexota bacterium]